MRTLRTSVRKLVEFLLRSGNIDAEHDRGGGYEAMQAGSDIHRMLQASGGKAYQAEVSLAGSIYFPDGAFSPHAARLEIREEAVSDQDGFFLRIEGRADGIIDDGTHPLLVDEIKGVSRDVSAIDAPDPIHEAQALCYAYLYLRKTRGSTALASSFAEQVIVRLTYASMTSGEVRHLEKAYDIPDIETWFFLLLQRAERWAAWRTRHDGLRNPSLAELEFPFEPRSGQRQLMDAVTAAIREERRLYVQASTGSGKTIATLFPALKAMGTGKVSRIAFLTAKTMTRRPVLDCLELLRRQDVAVNVLVVTARDKICPLRDRAQGADVRARPLTSLCNPHECPYARGHYDAVNDALYDAISTRDVLDATHITSVATRHHVCPYELQRDVTRWADLIICDYHYAFAPSASLFGLADDSDGGVYLVDEAHNLVERMRDMYSAQLVASDLKALERLLGAHDAFAQLTKTLRAVIATFPAWEKALPTTARSSARVRGRRPAYQVVRMSDELTDSIAALSDGIDTTLEEYPFPTGNAYGHDERAQSQSGTAIEAFLALRDMSLNLRGFLGALQRTEAGYVTFLDRTEAGGKALRIFCVNPSHDLDKRLEQTKAAVFFSGTLLPMEYHQRLLAAKEDDASLYVQASFDHRRQQVLIGTDLSARYSQRGPQLYARIASYLMALTHARPGNYLVFLPSYAMIAEVEKALGRLADNRTMIVQRPAMRETERERFVAKFRDKHASDASLVGLCVLGGIFGESIDLPGEALVGVVVVGTGMPRASGEREVIRDYFDAKEGRGFAYAYTYPGANKVLQAAGRLMRSEEDHGVVLLLDDRFLERELREVFPREWGNVQTCTLESMPRLLARVSDPRQ